MADGTTTLPARHASQTTFSGPAPEPSNADEIRARADAWQNVARRARASSHRGEDAVSELQRRRNTSGQ